MSTGGWSLANCSRANKCAGATAHLCDSVVTGLDGAWPIAHKNVSTTESLAKTTWAPSMCLSTLCFIRNAARNARPPWNVHAKRGWGTYWGLSQTSICTASCSRWPENNVSRLAVVHVTHRNTPSHWQIYFHARQGRCHTDTATIRSIGSLEPPSQVTCMFAVPPPTYPGSFDITGVAGLPPGPGRESLKALQEVVNGAVVVPIASGPLQSTRS
jgi:hypothetical protein